MPALRRPPFTVAALAFVSAAGPTMLRAQTEHPFVAAADREYAAIFSHPGDPCKSDGSTVSYETCIGKEISFTETHLAAFLTAVRGIAAGDDKAPPPSEAYGPRHELTSLNEADAAWRVYRKNLCGLAAAGFAGGSGMASVESECVYRLDRQYARQVADAVALSTLAK